MLKEKKFLQIYNIINTLIDATDHFSMLVKEKELNQSVFIFSSIVDGFGATKNASTLSQILDNKKENEKIEHSLYLIAKQLEQGNFQKISEILQFSLKPQLRNWKQTFEVEISSELRNRNVTIGVYLCHTNPRNAYPETRISALINESERQGVNLLFFSSADVDLDKKQVTANVFQNREWKRVTAPFPDVIHNLNIKSHVHQSHIERKLRKEIPFTTFGIGNKFYLPKKLVQSGRFAELLVPFKIVTDLSIIHEFLKENESAVLKPLRGRRGENIYFVEKKGNHYSLLDHKKKKLLSYENFEKWVCEVILKEKNSYMVQRYIHCRTTYGEPYDVRAHVQKDGEGKWTLTRIYPRIGNKKSILSNISRGGRAEDLGTLFANEFGKLGKQYEEEIRELSLNLTWHLDKLYGLALDELGLDLAIDKNGRFWLHEVNNGPQSTYHETERAVNTIAYAIYIAKNGVFYTNEFEKKINVEGQFNAQNSDLSYVNLDNRISVGMLTNQNEINKLTVACAYVANYENVNFYYFTPKDIDYDKMLIRGYFYENKEWVPKIVNYPSVIYDRLRFRGIQGYKEVYEELKEIPFTNEFFGNSISKLEVYDKLTSTGALNDAIIPYRRVSRVKDVLHYIQQYERVILKPEIGSFAKGVHFVSKIKSDDYFVAEGEKVEHYNEIALTQYLRELIKKEVYIVQKYIETRTKDGQPFDIRMHMMKDENGEWSFVNNYPRIGIHHAVISSTGNGGYIGELLGFLKRNFSEEKGKNLKSEIEALGINVAKTFEGIYKNNLSEIGLDIAIDKEMVPYIIEVNVNKPGMIYYEFEVAKHAISYAVHLAKNHDLESVADMRRGD